MDIDTDERTMVDEPLHVQIRNHLAALIDSGEVAWGEKLPTEVEMQNQFGVSRSTVRQALGDLERAGAVTRRRGVGTTVGGAIRPDMLKLTSFSEDMADRGLRSSSVLLEMDLVPAGAEVGDRLKIDFSQGGRVWYLKRLRLAEDEPVAIHHLYVPPDLALSPQALEDMDSYYQLLSTALDLKVIAADEVLRARLCNQEEADVLLCEEGDAVLEFERTTYAEDMRIVEYVRGIYRADRYEYNLSMYRGDRND